MNMNELTNELLNLLSSNDQAGAGKLARKLANAVALENVDAFGGYLAGTDGNGNRLLTKSIFEALLFDDVDSAISAAERVPGAWIAIGI